MQPMNFKEWIELEEGLGSFMIPMMLGATAPSAPPAQQPAAMIKKPNVEAELLRAIQQNQNELDAGKFKKNDAPELVKYAQDTKDALNILEDYLTGAINNGFIKIDNKDENYLKIPHYFDELRTRLDTFIAPENFEHLPSAFENMEKKYVTAWMDTIHEIKNKYLEDKKEAYNEFMKQYPTLLKKAELRASQIRGSHPEDSKAEFERYQKEIEANIQGKRKR
jgi:hypothetical protein